MGRLTGPNGVGIPESDAEASTGELAAVGADVRAAVAAVNAQGAGGAPAGTVTALVIGVGGGVAGGIGITLKASVEIASSSLPLTTAMVPEGALTGTVA